MLTTNLTTTRHAVHRTSARPQRRAGCDLRRRPSPGDQSCAVTADGGLRPTFAAELGRLSPAELNRRLHLTRDVVDEHERVWRFGGADAALADLEEAVLQGQITTSSPSWSESPRGDAALLQVDDDMALVLVRGNRHAEGETRLRPYLAIKAFYAPGAGEWR